MIAWFSRRYYLTANSCYHEGYQQYNWPSSWSADTTLSSMLCGEISLNGVGVPEQFWNCAEVRIFKGPDQNVNPATISYKTSYFWILSIAIAMPSISLGW